MLAQIWIAHEPGAYHHRWLYVSAQRVFIGTNHGTLVARNEHEPHWFQKRLPFGIWMKLYFKPLPYEVELPNEILDLITAHQLRKEQRAELRDNRTGLHGEIVRKAQRMEDDEHRLAEQYRALMVEELLSRGSYH